MDDNAIKLKMFVKHLTRIRTLYAGTISFSTSFWILIADHFAIYYGIIFFIFIFPVMLLREYSISRAVGSYYGTSANFFESLKSHSYIYKALILSIAISFFRVFIFTYYTVHRALIFVHYYYIVIILNILLLCLILIYRKISHNRNMFNKNTYNLDGVYSEILDELQNKFGIKGVNLKILKRNTYKIFNAFTVTVNKNLSFMVFTRDFSEYLNKEEITGIMAHEMAHIKNRDSYRFFIVYSLLLFAIMNILLIPYIFNKSYLLLSLFIDILVVIIFATRIPLLLYRRHREIRADITAAKYGFGFVLIKGIEILDRMNGYPAKKVKGILATHYSFEDRRKKIEEYTGDFGCTANEINLP